MTEKSLVAISAGVGVPSSTTLLANRLTEAVGAECDVRGGPARTRVIELREYAVDIANAMVTGYAAPRLAELVESVTAADGLIAVTPVFTASYSGLYKSFFDVIDNTALDFKPVLIAATGGTSRHSMVLEHAVRPLFSYLRARVAPTAVFAGPGDWGAGDDGVAGLDRRVDRAATELAALMGASGEAVTDPRAGRTEARSFEDLLGQMSG